MRKRGAVNSAFKLRWCVLNGGVLYYYVRPESSRYQGWVDVRGCRVWKSSEGGGFQLEVNPAAQERKYTFELDSEAARTAWLDAFVSNCSYNIPDAPRAPSVKQLLAAM